MSCGRCSYTRSTSIVCSLFVVCCLLFVVRERVCDMNEQITAENEAKKKKNRSMPANELKRSCHKADASFLLSVMVWRRTFFQVNS